MAERPASPWPETDGFESVAVPDPNWRPMLGKRCRRMTGPGRTVCREPSAAEMNRGYAARSGPRRENWWAYCADHLYGRWIEDGKVMHWILREKQDA